MIGHMTEGQAFCHDFATRPILRRFPCEVFTGLAELRQVAAIPFPLYLREDFSLCPPEEAAARDFEHRDRCSEFREDGFERERLFTESSLLNLQD